MTRLSLNKMGCFNDPAWKVCGGWGGVVADTNYLNPARWEWINSSLGMDQQFNLHNYPVKVWTLFELNRVRR